ncbi:MAG TPA: thioredoxin family protein [Pirellulales bacterium]|nr:thioredoxin family protein [Pirellulales bacterium]
MTRVVFALMVVGLCTVVDAGQFNPVLSIGDNAPTWTDLPGTDGKKHSLADFNGKDVVVVAFTCNSCPYAVDYEDRLIALAKMYSGPPGKVAIVAINVNKVPEDSLEQMRKRAEDKGFTFPYLFDESQKIAKDFGATFTPEFFVLNRDRKIVYMGAMDDNTDVSKANTNYVAAAVDAALAGRKPATTETVAIGCMIRYEKSRRSR